MAAPSATEWPPWALNSLLGPGAVCGGLALHQGWRSSHPHASSLHKGAQELRPAFRRFQIEYLSVYLTIMLADWLQGTNMYTLYQSYDVDVGALFLTGFTSAAVFGTFVGLYVDCWGRRLACILFCLLEIVVNALEHVPSFPLLLLGRVLGGISTSLLFSAFESWMVTEHRKRGFPESWLSSTFTLASSGNGLMAVLAGVVAQVAADNFGDIGPFRLAIVLTAFALVMVARWPENVSGDKGLGAAAGGAEAWRCIRADRRVGLLGWSCALYEGATYTFVFLWVPTLQGVAPGRLPTGLVFSCFMLAITTGGLLSAPLMQLYPVERLSVYVYGLAALSMLVPVAFPTELWAIFPAFLVLETTVGIFFATSSSMRAAYLPGALQASIMNLFRLPLNALVVAGTKLTDWVPATMVFLTISVWFFAAALLQLWLSSLRASHSPDKKAS